MINLRNKHQNLSLIYFVSVLLSIVLYIGLFIVGWEFFFEFGSFIEHSDIWLEIIAGSEQENADYYHQYKAIVSDNNLELNFVLHFVLPLIIASLISFIITLKYLYVKDGRYKEVNINDSILLKDNEPFKHAKDPHITPSKRRGSRGRNR
jgi:hypothetical protein